MFKININITFNSNFDDHYMVKINNYSNRLLLMMAKILFIIHQRDDLLENEIYKLLNMIDVLLFLYNKILYFIKELYILELLENNFDY